MGGAGAGVETAGVGVAELQLSEAEPPLVVGAGTEGVVPLDWPQTGTEPPEPKPLLVETGAGAGIELLAGAPHDGTPPAPPLLAPLIGAGAALVSTPHDMLWLPPPAADEVELPPA